jgi:hypothetical protein
MKDNFRSSSIKKPLFLILTILILATTINLMAETKHDDKVQSKLMTLVGQVHMVDSHNNTFTVTRNNRVIRLYTDGTTSIRIHSKKGSLRDLVNGDTVAVNYSKNARNNVAITVIVLSNDVKSEQRANLPSRLSGGVLSQPRPIFTASVQYRGGGTPEGPPKGH